MNEQNKKVPTVRFKGFTNDWEQRKLGDLFVYNRPDKYMVQDTNYIDSGTPVLTANKSFVLGYTNENHTYNKLPAIIFDDFTLENKFVKFPFMVKSSAIKILNSRNDQPMMFMYQLLQHSRFVHEGHSRHYISIVQRKDVMVPDNVEEQKKIATLFSRIQNIITLQQRKLDLLKQFKKGLLQKIFTKENTFYPTLRFQNFNLDWKQYKLSDLVKIDTGKLDANAMVSNGKYDFYTSGIKKYKINNYAFKGPAITIAGNGATVGYMHYADNKFNAYQRTYVLTDLKADRRFLFNSIQLILPHKIYQESRTGNIPYIVLSMLTDLLIMVPSNKEQTFIGNLAGTISDIYNKQLKKLNLTNQLKKSLLQQMFI